MSAFFTEFALFSAKVLVIFFFVLALLIIFLALVSKNKTRERRKLLIKNLNHQYENMKEVMLEEMSSKKEFKKFLKKRKAEDKIKKAEDKNKKIFVLNFQGDIQASAVASLREEISALLNVATPLDEVVVKLESAGGAVQSYGLAAAQLMRIRNKQIPLTIAIDKIAASGGYMMACVANKIISAPFAIIGSIGVVVELPNFHRFLQDKHVDIEQHTAGKYKRTVTMLGKITEAGRKKLQEEIDTIHVYFKKLIAQYRLNINIEEVATGEYWLATQALDLKLVDVIMTSDEYVQEGYQQKAQVYEISCEIKKSWLDKLTGRITASHFFSKWLSPFL